MICRRYLLGSGYTLEYLYTLEEMFADEFGNEKLVDFTPSLGNYSQLWNDFDITYWTDDDQVGRTLWEYIYATYRDHIALVSNEKWTEGDITEPVTDFFCNFYMIWKRTHNYYEKIISLLKDNENKLLAQISTITETDNRFNDTPDQSGDYSGLDYASTINKNKITTNSDAGTILERLEEVRRRYKDYYTEWTKEFSKIFISPLNYNEYVTLEDLY